MFSVLAGTWSPVLQYASMSLERCLSVNNSYRGAAFLPSDRHLNKAARRHE